MDFCTFGSSFPTIFIRQTCPWDVVGRGFGLASTPDWSNSSTIVTKSSVKLFIDLRIQTTYLDVHVLMSNYNFSNCFCERLFFLHSVLLQNNWLILLNFTTFPISNRLKTLPSWSMIKLNGYRTRCNSENIHLRVYTWVHFCVCTTWC